MSKASRRRRQPGPTPTTPPPASPPPPRPATSTGSTSATPSASSTTGAATGATGSTSTSGSTSTAGASGAPRPSTSRPAASRSGRRERQRIVAKPSFFQRYRTLIVVVAALAGVALLSIFVFASASASAFSCSTIWTPEPTASPAAGATPALGYIQPNMGAQHVNVGEKVTYTYCAPASGNHYNKPGTAGPIPARVYGPGDTVLPQGWIHNLEHGAIVILYRGDSTGATPDGQTKLKALYDAFPNSPICDIPKGVLAPVIARFDQMSTPFQAIVWGRVLPLDTQDDAKILAFYEQWAERTNPEKQCASPSASASAGASGSAAPSSSAAPSVAPSAAPTAAPTAAPSASAAPSPS